MAHPALQRGMWIRHQGHIYEIVDFHERHTGKQKPTVHVALRDVRDGRPVDRTLDDISPIAEVEHSRRAMQFVYRRGDAFVFMDQETFEEHELPGHVLGDRRVFLAEGETYPVLMLENAPMTVQVPDIVSLKVAHTAPAGHSVGVASNVTKEAVMENGLEVRVPLFIKSGDLIRIDTRTRDYAGKDHK